MIRKPGIPAITTADMAVADVLSALKENVEIITGARPGVSQVRQLSASATTTEIVTKINELIARLNASGN